MSKTFRSKKAKLMRGDFDGRNSGVAVVQLRDMLITAAVD